MSDVEAMLANRGAAAGSEAINARSESPAQSPPATRLSAGIYDQAAALKAAAAEAVAALSHAKSATAALNNLYEVDDTPKKSWKISINSKGHTELTTTQAAPEETAEACCVDAAQAAEQAAEFVRQAEAEARSQPRDSSAAAMSDVEAMLAKRGAAAGSEAIHAKRVTAAVVTLPSPVLTPRVAPERTRIVINAEDVFDAHINKLMLRSRKKFDHFDYDGNGLLEGAELVDLGEWLWSSFHPSEAASEKKKEAEGLKLLFRQDENGDGALSFEEFEGWFRKTCVAIEKYRRGLSNKPNLKMKPPVRKKMPKRQVAEVVEAHLPSEQVTVTAAPVVPRLKLGGVPSVVPRLKLGFNLGGVKKAEEVAPEATPEKPSSDDLDSMLAALGTPSPAKTGYNSYFERKLAAGGSDDTWTAKYPEDGEQKRSFSPLSVRIAEERKAIEAERDDDEPMSPMERAAQVIEEAAEEECGLHSHSWSPTSLAERFFRHPAHHAAFQGGDEEGLPEAPESLARGKWDWM